MNMSQVRIHQIAMKTDDDNQEKQQKTTDQSETNLLMLDHETCLTIQLNVVAKQCAKKLLNTNLYRRLDVCLLLINIRKFILTFIFSGTQIFCTFT